MEPTVKIVINYKGTVLEGLVVDTASKAPGTVLILELSKEIRRYYASKKIELPEQIKVQHVKEGFYREVL